MRKTMRKTSDHRVLQLHCIFGRVGRRGIIRGALAATTPLCLFPCTITPVFVLLLGVGNACKACESEW